jgi:hypothetical protein
MQAYCHQEYRIPRSVREPALMPPAQSVRFGITKMGIDVVESH